MRIAIHQPNFVPWLPYFYKMAQADIFILLCGVQFEKNGYQNRFNHKDEWITKPVRNGKELIWDKNYADGQNLLSINMGWIYCIKRTLGIETIIALDVKAGKPMCKEVNGTDRIISLVKEFNGTTYITNPEAKDKYLDEIKVVNAGIDIEYCNVPKDLKISTFEAFEKWGIEGTKKQLQRGNI